MVKFELKKISLEILNNWHKIRSFFLYHLNYSKSNNLMLKGDHDEVVQI
jgi:hypothetical protein|tara:strand:- start:14858 stop:15004 length:147 start_codon:yes stop_codon:yes gene_type:complete